MTTAANPTEYLKLIGRDGAYAEYGLDRLHELVQSVKENKPLPKVIALTVPRLELSDPKHIHNLQETIANMVRNGEFEGMDKEQIGLLIFRAICIYGLSG